MTDHPIKNSDAQVVSLPNTSNTENESARRLKQEVERLAALPTVEWIYYIESDGYAARFDVDKATLRRMVEATIKEREKKAHEAKADDRRAEQKQERDDRRSRQERSAPARRPSAYKSAPARRHDVSMRISKRNSMQ